MKENPIVFKQVSIENKSLRQRTVPPINSLSTLILLSSIEVYADILFRNIICITEFTFSQISFYYDFSLIGTLKQLSMFKKDYFSIFNS